MSDLYNLFKIDSVTENFCLKLEKELTGVWSNIENAMHINGAKVLHAMQKNKLSDTHFAATTGYGYNDLGREVVEQIYADVFRAEAGLVRPQLISGTHALTVALFGNLRPGDELLSPVGKPYDTLEGVIGIRPTNGSLKEYGIAYKQVDLNEDFSFNYDGIKEAITHKTKLITIQRSKGYSYRPTLTIAQIKDLITFVKAIKPDVICMVDNCYGEFVDVIEPTEVGADLCVGSLIKNPGGGLAPIGGYIVGKEEYVENAAMRLTAPGLGKEVGATLGLTQPVLQGLFLAPEIVANALKGAVFAAAIFEKLGFQVMPSSLEKRSDIIQAINMQSPENVIAFCQGIQKGAPVDSFVNPEPWDMPGYDSPVIMAAGAFIQGASIELSADAPIKPPYTVFFQGGLTFYHARLGVMKALQTMKDKGLVSL
ncbi:methionine gamma-lyase family protein [Cellulosilyticum sp. I15G10I2]|uniref:methionine gamma-lyase family protein n=1 Tax=Cellulosilyticum sp. I15G10I2 TaxID=1892843 RepID=UPI00085C4F47|nr:methionine gamma-lyase family protein [Cellulosilyticum sp. I15G10I2]